MSTLGDYHDECGGYHEYTRGRSVHWGTFSTLEDVQYTGGRSVHWGDTMSTPGAYHDECGGYHEYTGGVQYTGGYHEYTGGC